MILISIITSCLIFIGVITVIILSHLDKIIDKSLKKKVTGHTLYYADFSEIKSMDEIFTYIKNKVVYRSELTDNWSDPEITLKRHYGDCEDFAILYLNILYCRFKIKGSIVIVQNDLIKSKSIVSGGTINHAMNVVNDLVIEPQTGKSYGLYENLKNKIGYIYSFNEIFAYYRGNTLND